MASQEAQKDEIPLKRIRNLLRLAQSSNEHEADLARHRAEDLMRHYNISEKDVVEQATEVAALREELARLTASVRTGAAA